MQGYRISDVDFFMSDEDKRKLVQMQDEVQFGLFYSCRSYFTLSSSLFPLHLYAFFSDNCLLLSFIVLANYLFGLDDDAVNW